MDPRTVFGQNLRRIREDGKLSQEELADRAELHRTYIGSIERGERNLSILNIVKLARTLNVSISDLFEGIETVSG
jgi:transcriptional regulator with XRE-family HTH domain